MRRRSRLRRRSSADRASERELCIGRKCSRPKVRRCNRDEHKSFLAWKWDRVREFSWKLPRFFAFLNCSIVLAAPRFHSELALPRPSFSRVPRTVASSAEPDTRPSRDKKRRSAGRLPSRVCLGIDAPGRGMVRSAPCSSRECTPISSSSSAFPQKCTGRARGTLVRGFSKPFPREALLPRRD